MKLVTHYVFSTGLLTLLSSFFLNFYTAFFLSSVVAVLGNSLIDRLGHKEIQTRRGLIPVSTRRIYGKRNIRKEKR
jgi:uncharacterized membrane protein YjjP (DUF1212 family)